MGGSRYFSQSLSPRPKSAKGVVRHSSLKKKIYSIYLCVAICQFFGARAAGYRAVVASTPVSTYGVEAPAARTHGARFERYVGAFGSNLLIDPCLVPCSADSWRRLAWRRCHDYKPTFLGIHRHSGRPTFSTLFLNLLLGACIFLVPTVFPFDPPARG
jgi:hypothetical protein